jgi:hypothetical protein
MLLHLAVSFAAAAFAATPPPPAVTPPPLPDFKTSVDYRAWYDQQVAYAKADNAADAYGIFLFAKKGDALEQLIPDSNSKAGKQLRNLMMHPQPWVPKDNPEFAEWCESVDSKLHTAFEAGVGRAHMGPRPTSAQVLLAEIAPPRLDLGRVAGQMEIARGWRVSGNTFYTDNLVNALKHNIIFAEHIGESMGVEEQLFASGHRLMVYTQLKGVLRSRTTELDVCRDLRTALDEVDTTPVTLYLQRSLYFQEAAALQLLQHLCTEYEAEPKLHAQPQERTVLAYFESRFTDPKRRPAGWEKLKDVDGAAAAAAIHEYYESMRAVLAAPTGDVNARTEAITAKLLEKNAALEAVVMPVDMLVNSVLQTEAQRRMARLFLEMATVFKWPASMDELNFPRKAECRIDPFSGQDFHLRVVGPRAGLYSVGPDGKDDGGEDLKDIGYFATVPLDAGAQPPADPAGGTGAAPNTNGAPQNDPSRTTAPAGANSNG